MLANIISILAIQHKVCNNMNTGLLPSPPVGR